jgi:hypothetical protein
MYQRALQGKEKAWGLYHMSTDNTRHGQRLGRSLQIPGQAQRSREDVPAGTARKGESMGSGSYINPDHSQQLGPSLQIPGQAGRG